MTSVLVGVHVHAEPARLMATLEALERPGRRKLDVLLLPDGPDRETAAAIAGLGLSCSATAHAAGPPACFNRLAAESDADVVILLDSGAVPATGALDRLVDALARHPKAGIAGPSTNAAWNEQGAFPDAGGGTATDVARTARKALRLYRDEVRTLEPLHSVADFCYAVRRDVIGTIGGADEAYGLGPCWELEYNVRAARAGFDCVWVCSAYVWRPDFTARRRQEERRRFDANRRRYQDSVCGLRLRGEKEDYEPHCRGDDCEHFAPAGLMRIRRPLPAAASPRTAARATPRTPEPPLVSCIMPTRDRADFALQAVRLFQRQDYPNRELVIVDDGDDGLDQLLPEDPRIRYLRAPRGESIGAKRNRACEAARGTYIAHWDDDDWYGPGRLSAQTAPLLARRADITGLVTDTVFELAKWRFWRLTPALHSRLFAENVHGGTLVYSRHVWERLARYPDISLAEDARFLTRARSRGARLQRVEGGALFVYLRHGTNAWRFSCGTFVDSAGWRQAEEPALPAEDRAFYEAHSRSPSAPRADPLVTCIMPTRDRRAFVPIAIECFLRQDYTSRELLVVDDGQEAIRDLVPPDPRIRYERLEQPMVLGAKRNFACRVAHGELIAHWDDDDWSAPRRLSVQVEALQRNEADVAGLHELLFFDPVAGRAWLYAYPHSSSRPWVAGGTLCYFRSFWEAHPFSEIGVGEDTRFLWARRARVVTLDDSSLYVATVHGKNTSVKRPRAPRWRPVGRADVSVILGADERVLRAAAAGRG